VTIEKNQMCELLKEQYKYYNITEPSSYVSKAADVIITV
jgi:hypothetical protein